jgi:hypothetical protein
MGCNLQINRFSFATTETGVIRRTPGVQAPGSQEPQKLLLMIKNSLYYVMF